MAGYLDQGQWRSGWYDTTRSNGAFQRVPSQFTGRLAEARGEAGRFHLYVSLACPWAHRTLILRRIKQLESLVSVSVVEPVMGEQGWAFSSTFPDTENGFEWMHQAYVASDPGYSGRVSVPVLWDRKLRQIVSNESAEIVRFFNSAFDHLTGNRFDLVPEPLFAQVEEWNQYLYENVNDGVYRCGFAGTQAAYGSAVGKLFNALDHLDGHLAKHRFLLGEVLTESDWRLFVTLVRFDSVYHYHFKCSRQRIADYRNLSGYLRDLYQWPGIASTMAIDHIVRHYYLSHPHLNPSGLIPVLPTMDFDSPHSRETLGRGYLVEKKPAPR